MLRAASDLFVTNNIASFALRAMTDVSTDPSSIAWKRSTEGTPESCFSLFRGGFDAANEVATRHSDTETGTRRVNARMAIAPECGRRNGQKPFVRARKRNPHEMATLIICHRAGCGKLERLKFGRQRVPSDLGATYT